MSQYPTGQIGPTSAVRQRRVSDNDPRVGQTESLGVFGVTPTTAIDDRGVNSARALMAALGVVDRSLAVSAQEVRQQRDDAEREAEKNERLFRGIGAERTIEVGPQLLEDVRTGKIRPNEGEDYAAFADRIIRERAALPDDDAATPIAIDEMRKRLSTGLQNEAIRLVNEESDRQRKEMSSLIVSGAAGKSAGELRAAIAELRTINPDASEEALRDTVATASLQVAALQGNEAAFKEAASLLPENSPDRVKYQNEINRVKAQEEAARTSAFRQKLAGMRVDEAPSAVIRAEIAAHRGKGVPESIIEDEIHALDIRDERDRKEALAASLDQFNTAEAARVRDTDATTALSAYEFGGLARITGDYEWTDPAGQTHKITREQRIENGVNAAFERIDGEGRTPEDAFAQKIDVLANNGARYDPWSNVMEAGSTAVIQSVRVRRENGEKVETLPANAQDGFALWKQLKATNDRVLSMHVSPRTDDLYSLAALAERQGYPPAQALFLAATTQGRSPYGTVSDEDVAKETGWVDGENAQDIMALVRDTARLSVRPGFADPKTAIKEASKRVRASHRKVGNVWIPTGNRSIHPNFEPASERLLDDWHGLHGEETGIPRGRITLFPSSNGAGWMVYDKRANLPVDTDWFVSDADIAAAEERRLASIRDEITNDPFRQVKAAIKNAAAEGAMTQILGPPGARDILTKGVGRAADAAGDALARAPIFPTGTTVGELNRDVNIAAGRAKMAGAVALSRGVAGAASWLVQRPGESDQRYTARTGRKSP